MRGCNIPRLLDEITFQDDQIVGVGGIPADSDDVEPGFDREVDELSLVIQALAANVLIAIVTRPGHLCIEQLPADAAAPQVWQHGPEPVIEHAWLEFEADPETDRAIVHPRDQREAVVTPEETTLEEVDLPPRAKHLVIEFDCAGQQGFVSDDDVYVGQGSLTLSAAAGFPFHPGDLAPEPHSSGNHEKL